MNQEFYTIDNKLVRDGSILSCRTSTGETILKVIRYFEKEKCFKIANLTALEYENSRQIWKNLTQEYIDDCQLKHYADASELPDIFN